MEYEKERGRSGNFDRLSDCKVSPLLRFNFIVSVSTKNAISRSHGKFFDVRKKSGKIEVEKGATRTLFYRRGKSSLPPKH